MLRVTAIIVALLAMVAESHAGGTIAITACGQVVPPGYTAVLMNDIVCPPWGVCYPPSPCAPPGVPCQPIQPTVACRAAAECPDPAHDNCYPPPGKNGSIGLVLGRGARLEMNSHSLSGSYYGLLSGTFDSSGVLVSAGKMTIKGPGAIFQTQEAGFAVSLKADGISIHGNPLGFWANRIDAKNLVGSANGVFLVAERSIKASGLAVTGGEYGVISDGSAKISDSSITGNTAGDIETVRRPRVRNVVCDHSAQLVPTGQPGQFAVGPPWGVCSGD
jgi:hypothetical protein